MTESNFLFDVEALNAKNRRQKAQQKITPATRTMLLMLTEWDMNKDITASLLDLADMELAHIRYIAGPVIVHRSMWADTIPKWIFKAIAIDRLKQVFAEHDQGIVGKLATSSEVVAVMMPVSFEAPMQSRWVDVYLWACNEAIVSHNRLKGGVKDAWEIIGGRPIEYKSIKHDYEELARDIRSKVVEAAKLKGWKKHSIDPGEKPKKKYSAEASEIEGQLNILELDSEFVDGDEDGAAPELKSEVMQTNLFDLLG